MNVLYIGQVVPDEKIGGCSAYSVPGDIFQKNIIYGLNRQENVNIYVISCYPNASFPRHRIYVSRADDKLENGIDVVNVSYINVPIVKQKNQKAALKKAAEQLINRNHIDLILVYNMYPQFGGAALELSHFYKKPLVALLADFPNDEGKFWGGNDSAITKIMNAITWRNIRKVKYAIALNENVKNYIASSGKMICMPGGIDPAVCSSFDYKKVENRDVVYAGALTEYSGITNLIEAVNSVDVDNICLKIYGDGPLRERIKECVNQKISYMGNVSIDEMRRIMKESWILVNPRSTEEFVSSVTFPSKLFEYIITSRPVISTEFVGMPDNIRNIIWGCGMGNPVDIERQIKDIAEMNEQTLKAKVKIAYDSILENYSWDANCKRIKAFCEAVVQEYTNDDRTN